MKTNQTKMNQNHVFPSLSVFIFIMTPNLILCFVIKKYCSLDSTWDKLMLIIITVITITIVVIMAITASKYWN